MTTSIKRPEGFLIPLPGGGSQHGVDQEWYARHWQRTAGCGPCTASNILRYYRDRLTLPLPAEDKAQMQRLMAWVWEYIRPGMMGLNTTARYQQGMDSLLQAIDSPMRTRTLDIDAARDSRPSAGQVADFLREALAADQPVAFLNLSNGALKNLENWHWVTIIGLDESGGRLQASAVDNGRLLDLDMDTWLDTTTRGGGFAVTG